MDRSRRSRKRSDHALKSLIEATVHEACCLHGRGLAFHVDEVQPIGRPPQQLTVWATLHFTRAGSPFCCGEPDCQLGLRGDRLARAADQVRRSMGLQQAVVLDFGDRVRPEYAKGVEFHYGHQDGLTFSVEGHPTRRYSGRRKPPWLSG